MLETVTLCPVIANDQCGRLQIGDTARHSRLKIGVTPLEVALPARAEETTAVSAALPQSPRKVR